MRESMTGFSHVVSGDTSGAASDIRIPRYTIRLQFTEFSFRYNSLITIHILVLKTTTAGNWNTKIYNN